MDVINKDFLEIEKLSLIKRVIGLPGDHIQIKEGSVYLNGEKLEENYLDKSVFTESFVLTDFTVPEGYYFIIPVLVYVPFFPSLFSDISYRRN